MEDVPKLVVEVYAPTLDHRDAEEDHRFLVPLHVGEVEGEGVQVNDDWVSAQVAPEEGRDDGEKRDLVLTKLGELDIVVQVSNSVVEQVLFEHISDFMGDADFEAGLLSLHTSEDMAISPANLVPVNVLDWLVILALGIVGGWISEWVITQIILILVFLLRIHSQHECQHCDEQQLK